MNAPLAAQTKRPGALVSVVVLNVINALFGLITSTLLLSGGAPDVLVVGIPHHDPLRAESDRCGRPLDATALG